MRRYRIALGAAGGLLLAYGAIRMLFEVSFGSLLWVVAWMIAAVILHDGVLSPLVASVGVGLTRVPPRARRYLQWGLIAGALVTVIALPLIALRGSQPVAKAILQRDYAGGLALLLALIAAVALARYLARVARDRRAG